MSTRAYLVFGATVLASGGIITWVHRLQKEEKDSMRFNKNKSQNKSRNNTEVQVDEVQKTKS